MLDPVCVYKTPCGWCAKFDKECDVQKPKCKSKDKGNNTNWLSQSQINKVLYSEKNKSLTK